MSSLPLPNTGKDVTLDGPHAKLWAVSASEYKALRVHRISRIGIDSARPPYQRVRSHPGGSFLMMVLEGQGRAFLEGKWQTLTPGWVAMAPPRILNAFQATGTTHWTIAWIRYDEPPFVNPLIGAGSPLKIKTDVQKPYRAWQGLHEETTAEADPRAIHHWVELIHLHVKRLTTPWHKEQRLRHLWLTVEQDLGRPWTIQSLASHAHMSEEHLRRLCWRETGRSPVAHLTSLRMERARHLLCSTNDKIETIALTLGYSTAEAFSRTFTRCVGLPPKEFRGGAGGF